jgi:hypothetical protein
VLINDIVLTEPSVMPLNSLGVVDVEGIGISDTELGSCSFKLRG